MVQQVAPARAGLPSHTVLCRHSCIRDRRPIRLVGWVSAYMGPRGPAHTCAKYCQICEEGSQKTPDGGEEHVPHSVAMVRRGRNVTVVTSAERVPLTTARRQRPTEERSEARSGNRSRDNPLVEGRRCPLANPAPGVLVCVRRQSDKLCVLLVLLSSIERAGPVRSPFVHSSKARCAISISTAQRAATAWPRWPLRSAGAGLCRGCGRRPTDTCSTLGLSSILDAVVSETFSIDG